MDWLEIAKELPVGHTVRSDCPQCGWDTNTNAAIINHSAKSYSLYCNACSYNPFEMKGRMTLQELAHLKALNETAANWDTTSVELPSDTTTDIPLKGRLWLYSNGITESVWRENHISYSPSLERVILPVYDDRGTVCWYQGRAIYTEQRPKYLQPKREREAILFKAKHNKRDQDCAVITEDILSAIRVSNTRNAYALMGTKITTAQSVYLSNYAKVIIWLDDDKAGRRAARDIAKSLSLVTEVCIVRTAQDPKKLSNETILRTLNEVHT